jgi:hypothetical protein
MSCYRPSYLIVSHCKDLTPVEEGKNVCSDRF